jgi:hypothetical protein
MMMFVSSSKGKPAALCNITSPDLGGGEGGILQVNRGSG